MTRGEPSKPRRLTRRCSGLASGSPLNANVRRRGPHISGCGENEGVTRASHVSSFPEDQLGCPKANPSLQRHSGMAMQATEVRRPIQGSLFRLAVTQARMQVSPRSVPCRRPRYGRGPDLHYAGPRGSQPDRRVTERRYGSSNNDGGSLGPPSQDTRRASKPRRLTRRCSGLADARR